MTIKINLGPVEYRLVEEPTVGLVEQVQLALVDEKGSTVGRLVKVINLALAEGEPPLTPATRAKFDELMSAWRLVLRHVGFKEDAAQGEGAAPASGA